MKNNKKVALLSSAAIGTLIATALTTTAYAKTDAILTEKDGKLFQYNYEDLKTAEENNAVEVESPLFKQYDSQPIIKAFHDDVKGYINAESVLKAEEDAVLNDEEFNLDDFIEKADLKDSILKVDNVIKVVEKDGKVVEVKKEEILKVESVSAINATTVQLTVPKAAKEADLVGKKVTLTAGKTVLTATYMDGSLADAKANFLLDGAKKVVDATSYKMTADWASFTPDTFMAKIPGTVKYAKTFEMVTASVPEAATTDVYFTAKDQYGDAIAIIDANNDDLTVEVKKNGMPLNATEVPAITAAENAVEGKIKVHINKALVKGDTLEITLGNRSVARDLETAFKAQPIKLTVGDKIEGEVGAVDIKGITATYAAANNEHKTNDTVVDVLPNDKVTLAANVVNQLGNPVVTVPGGLVRWTVEEVSGNALVANPIRDITPVAGQAWNNDTKTIDTQDNKFTFTANNPGTLKVTAYNIANGKNVSWTIQIGAAKLEANLGAPTFTTAGTNNPYNHENYVSNRVVYTAGAALTPEMLKFEVTSVPSGATKDDIQLTAAYGTTDATKDQIFITAKTNKVGAYKFKAYVGESFAKATSVFGESTVTTVVNSTVDKIEVAEVKANELQAHKDLVKEIKFTNKWNEQVDVYYSNDRVPNDAHKTYLTVAPTNGLTVIPAKNEAGVVADDEGKITHVKFNAPAKGSYVANFVAGPKSLSLPVTVAETGKVQSITLGKVTTTLIQNDAYDAKSDTDDVVVMNVGGTNKAFKLIAVSAKDSYGNDVDLAADQINPQVAPNGNVEFKYFKGLKAADEVTGANKGVKYIGIYSDVDASAADVQKTITVGTNLDKVDGFAAPQLTATVKKARAIKDVTVTPIASTVASINGQVKYKVTAVDQYNTPFAMTQEVANKFKVVANENYEQVNSEHDNLNTLDEGSAIVTIKGKVAGDYTPVIYNDADNNNNMANTELNKTLSLKVQEIGDAINSLAIEDKAEVTPHNIDKYEANLVKNPVQVVKHVANTIKLTPKAFDASNNEVAFDAASLIWSVKSVNLKYADGKDVVADNVADPVTVANGTVTITPHEDKELSGTIVIKVSTLNGKVAEKTINITSEAAKAQSGTYYLAKADATDKAITSIVLDKDDANGVEEVVLVAKDQYGKKFEVIENANTVKLGQDSSAYFDEKSDENSINVTAKAVGSSTLRVFVNGNQEAILTITVDKDAVAAANKAVSDAVKAEIAVLSAKDDVQIANKQAVTTARNHYNALTQVQKDLVGDITKLTEAEAKIAELEGAAVQAKARALQELKEEIKKVAIEKQGKNEGETVGNQVIGSGDTLEAAKRAAEATVTDEANKSTEELTQAKNTLNREIEKYKAAIVKEAVANTKTVTIDSKAAGSTATTTITLDSSAGETLELVGANSNVATVSKEDSTGVVTVKSVKNGNYDLTVKVKKDGKVIRTVKVTVTVSNQS